MTGRRGATAILFGIMLMSPAARSTPVVFYSTVDLGGGLFRYDLSVANAGGSEALSGLNVLHGDSVFGLDDTSAIGEPSGWSSFAPLPPLVHDLDYFSLASSGDVSIDGVLGGFSFESTTDPSTLSGDDFAVEGIGASSASQIGLGTAQLVPEPSTASLLLLGVGGLLARRRTGSRSPREA